MVHGTELTSVDARLEYERQTARPEDIDFERIGSEEEDYESAPPTYEINTYPSSRRERSGMSCSKICGRSCSPGVPPFQDLDWRRQSESLKGVWGPSPRARVAGGGAPGAIVSSRSVRRHDLVNPVIGAAGRG